MSAVPEIQTTDDVQRAFEALQAGYQAHPYPSARTRKKWLKDLLDELVRRREDIARAISADWGHRSWHESMVADVWQTADALRHALKYVEKWMKPERRGIPYYFRPATGRVWKVPKGVVGVIAPWNYPVLLALGPAGDALAAGNRVLIKPSEQCPRTSALIAEIVSSVLPPDVCQVVQGGPDVSAAVSDLPLDHLFFTGSPRVGKMVMAAAANNLTPVTLELGGKCPLIVTPGFDPDRAAESLALGKGFNAGQICLAVDTLLVHRRDRDAVLAAFRRAATEKWPAPLHNPDFSSVSSPKHAARLKSLVDEARQAGAEVFEINPDDEDFSDSPKMPITVVVDAPLETRVATEEIFGPVLNVVSYDHLHEVKAWLRDHPDPLTLYWMDDDPDRTHEIVLNARSGGMVVNDVLFHFASPDLPFGGIRTSGIGQGHGHWGFDTFSHSKAVAYQARLNGIPLFHPPYGNFVNRMLDFFIGTE